MDFVDDDHSLLLVILNSSAWLSRLVSGVKRFQDMMGCSVFIDVTIGVFIFLLKLCTTGIHLSLACSYTLDSQDRDGFGMSVASGALAFKL